MCISPKSHRLEQGRRGQSQGWRSPQCKSWAPSPSTKAGHLTRSALPKDHRGFSMDCGRVEQCCRLLPVAPSSDGERGVAGLLSNLEVTISRTQCLSGCGREEMEDEAQFSGLDSQVGAVYQGLVIVVVKYILGHSFKVAFEMSKWNCPMGNWMYVSRALKWDQGRSRHRQMVTGARREVGWVG